MLSRLFLLAVLLPFALGCLPTKGKDDDVKATTVAAITTTEKEKPKPKYQISAKTSNCVGAQTAAGIKMKLLRKDANGRILSQTDWINFNAENNRIKKDKDVKEEDRNRPNVMLTKNDCNQNPSVCDDVTEILIEYKRLDGWYPLSIDVILNDKPFTFTNPTPAADDLSCTAPNTVKNWLTGYPQCSSYIKEGWTQQQIDDDEKKVAWWVIGKNGVKHTLNKADSEKYLANNLERPHEPCPLK